MPLVILSNDSVTYVIIVSTIDQESGRVTIGERLI